MPYSNAHLNDLLKRFKNGNHQEVADSLSFIKELTKEVCLTQYWNDTVARWHHRNPYEYFDAIVEEMEDEESSKELDGLFEPLKEFGVR
ncbi:MAG: hypothetical protein IPP69_12940 [Flavobacteriales bacterium]|nr:hypothetical protein [Flavobacteriales bacterium]